MRMAKKKTNQRDEICKKLNSLNLKKYVITKEEMREAAEIFKEILEYEFDEIATVCSWRRRGGVPHKSRCSNCEGSARH